MHSAQPHAICDVSCLSVVEQLKASKDETGRPAYYLRRALLNPGSDYIFNVQPGVQVGRVLPWGQN